MIISILKRFRRGLSPVITVIFLFAIILGAIAVSLGIIIPQVQELSDNIELETAGSSLLSLNSDIKSLIFNGEGSKVFTKIDEGREGFFFVDTESTSKFRVINSTEFPLFNETHYRYRIRTPVDSDTIPEGSHQYLKGSSTQNFFGLNSTNKDKAPWEILNQSRSVDSDNVLTSLSYRYIFKVSRTIGLNEVNATVQIQLFDINLTGKTGVSGDKPQITITNRGVQINETDFKAMNGDFKLKLTTLLSDPNAQNSVEHPVFIEAPENDNLNVKLQFVFHQLDVLI